jgi:hypothetical protein
MALIQILAIIITLAATIFWLVQLIDLMSRRDDEFPARFDKPTWAFILVVTSVLGAIAFAIAKPTKQPKLTLDTMLPEPKPVEPIICMECGNTIPSDRYKCPSCGWSYETRES